MMNSVAIVPIVFVLAGILAYISYKKKWKISEWF